MKVLLVHPVPLRSHWPRGRFRSHWVPTGLLYLSTVLRRSGHEVRVVHREGQLVSNGCDWEAADAYLRSLLVEFRPEMVGLSVVTPSAPEAETIARLTKEICGDGVVVVAGGPHPTALPERTLTDCPAIDAVVLGEGEETILELADSGPSPSVAGLVLRQDGGFLRTDRRSPVEDLDSLGSPDYGPFDMEFFLRPNRWLVRWLEQPGTNLRTSRGCTNRCTFCAGHVVAGPSVRFHSKEYVWESLVRGAIDMGARLINFEDETFAADRTRLLELCELLRRHDVGGKVSWQCCLRVDQVDREVLKGLKSAGCFQIEYGFESGSDAVLRRMSKGTSVEMNRHAVRLTREAGIRIYANIMMGLPGETEEDLASTVKFLQWARPEIFNLGCLLPFPGTDIYAALSPEQRDSLTWSDFTYGDRLLKTVNITAMSPDRFNDLYHKYYKYFIRPSLTLSLLRNTPTDQGGERRRLRRKLAWFAVRHPLRAARLPW